MTNITDNSIADEIVGDYDQFVISEKGSLAVSGIPKDKIICPCTQTLGCKHPDETTASPCYKWFEVGNNNQMQKLCYVNLRTDANSNNIIDRAKSSSLIGFTKGYWHDRLTERFKECDKLPFVFDDYVKAMKTYCDINLKQLINDSCAQK